MAIPQEPVINDWYRDSQGSTMKVVAFDMDDRMVEVQLFDGDITEYDLDTWYQLGVTEIPAPEDWSGPFDDLIADDFGNTEQPMHPVDWNGPANEMELED